MIYPRPFQLNCVNALFEYFIHGGVGNPLAAIPTGGGKSLIPPMFMHRALTTYPDQRMLVLTHVKELIEQNFKALHQVWPTAPATIYSASLGKKEGHAPIVVGGVGSVVNAIGKIGRRDLLFIDEAHLLSPKEDSMYQKVIEQLRQYNPYMKVIGLTATPFRMGQGRLTDNVFREGVEYPSMFTDMAFDLTSMHEFNQLIDDIYLCPLIPHSTENVIDVSDVRALEVDFNQKQLQESIERQGITGKALTESADLLVDRKSWIVFGAGIKNCIQIASMLNSMGIAAVAVHSNTKEFPMTKESREKAISAFKAGRFRAIVSNNILTTGFDHPLVDAIIDLRPTTSIPLHIQKYGRGTRVYFPPWFTHEQLQHKEIRKQAMLEGKKFNCKVLDFAGNTLRLGPINDPSIPKAKKNKGTGDVPVKLCDECGAYNHTTARVCCECGKEFIFKTKLKTEASTADIIARDIKEIEYAEVTDMFASIHQKEGKPDSLKVRYMCGFTLYTVYLHFEGRAKHMGRQWWRQHAGDEVPETAAEALSRFAECHKTKTLRVDITGKYPQVLEYTF